MDDHHNESDTVTKFPNETRYFKEQKWFSKSLSKTKDKNVKLRKRESGDTDI